jgi:hypothetical protein
MVRIPALVIFGRLTEVLPFAAIQPSKEKLRSDLGEK